MAFPAKPALDVTWTDGNAAKITDPGSTKKTLGWTLNERPAFQFWNWLMYAHQQWNSYFQSVTDQLILAQQKYAAIVGAAPGCTHATLALALADAAVPAGSNILVVSSATISSTIQISKNYIGIEFLPGVTYTNSAAGSCFQISAIGVRIFGGRLASFTNGITIDSGKNTNFITEMIFAACTNDVVDNNPAASANNVIANNVTE